METTNLLAVITFAMVTAFTPGPNNLMLAASGANFGFRRTLPHIAGITIGFMTVFLAASAGLASLFAALPQLYDLLKSSECPVPYLSCLAHWQRWSSRAARP